MRERMRLEEVVPDAYRAVYGLEKYCVTNVEPSLLELVKLRASMVNGCAFCVDMHSRDGLAAGETPERLFAVSAWDDAVCFTPKERAALALTDAVTKLGEGGVSDAVWDEAAGQFSPAELGNLLIAIATINVWNRLSVPTRRAPAHKAPATVG